VNSEKVTDETKQEKEGKSYEKVARITLNFFNFHVFLRPHFFSFAEKVSSRLPLF
jgi:hypothetical protein